MSNPITVKELRGALEGMPDDGIIEIAIRIYNKVYPNYITLCRSSWDMVAQSLGENRPCVRLFSSLPSEGETYSYIATRKKTNSTK